MDKKIKLFEEYFNEGIIKFEDFDKKEKNEEVTVTGDDENGNVTIELTPDEEADMADDQEEECDDDHLEEAKDPLLVTSKDVIRIQDIMEKAAGNMEKAKRLAETMCKLITDKWKALRRARAAEREGQDILADIFINRAKELGAFGA